MSEGKEKSRRVCQPRGVSWTPASSLNLTWSPILWAMTVAPSSNSASLRGRIRSTTWGQNCRGSCSLMFRNTERTLKSPGSNCTPRWERPGSGGDFARLPQLLQPGASWGVIRPHPVPPFALRYHLSRDSPLRLATCIPGRAALSTGRTCGDPLGAETRWAWHGMALTRIWAREGRTLTRSC